MPTVRYFAAAAAAAGRQTEQVEGSDVGAVLAAVVAAHGAPLAHVVRHSSLLLDGRFVADHGTPLATGDVLDVLPPFAGG